MTTDRGVPSHDSVRVRDRSLSTGPTHRRLLLVDRVSLRPGAENVPDVLTPRRNGLLPLYLGAEMWGCEVCLHNDPGQVSLHLRVLLPFQLNNH